MAFLFDCRKYEIFMKYMDTYDSGHNTRMSSNRSALYNNAFYLVHQDSPATICTYLCLVGWMYEDVLVNALVNKEFMNVTTKCF